MAGGASRNLALMAGLADELASAAGALLGATGTAAEVGGEPAADWFVRARASGSRQGIVTLGFAAGPAAALARQAMGFDEDPEDEVVADMLREVVAQAFGALGQTPEGKGTQFAVDVPAREAAARPGGAPLVFRLKLGDALDTLVAAWDGLTAAAATENASAPAAIVPTAPIPASPVVPAGAAPAPALVAASAFPNLDVILDIDLPLSVRFGETEMTVDALTKLGPGSVIDLGRSPDDPVDVLVNGRMVAKGEVVVVAGSYGVRITEVVSAADRLRTMAA